MDVLFFQSADPFRYRPMLCLTSSNVAAYCERHGFAYESSVGIKRGVWAWHASFNRIILFRELLDRGHRGWAVYLDADAWINDLAFDARAYLAAKNNHAAILTADHDSARPGDLHSGVVLVNLGHPGGRRLVERWHDAFLAIPDTELRSARDWLEIGNDEDLLRRVVCADDDLGAAVFFETKRVINSRGARFIRQHLRSDTEDLQRRTANIAAELETVGGEDRDRTASVLDDRSLSALRHPNGRQLPLVEAATGRPDLAAAAEAVARWAEGGGAEATPQQHDLRRALASGDVRGVADLLAAFGRSPAANGYLGGLQQHRRVVDDPAFARKRALRTHDELTSLAEACGALRIENPDVGLWGFNIRASAADLLDRIGAALAIDATPPDRIGAYLGLDAGNGRVVHHRMVEAIHSAWRIKQVLALLDLGTVTEIGGGIGLNAFYARRFGVDDYAIIDDTIMASVQTYLLAASACSGGMSITPGDRYGIGADLLFVEEMLPGCSDDVALDRLRRARDAGVRAILSVGHEARAAQDRPGSTMADLVAAVGGFRLAQRTPHAIRPGFVEELFVAAPARAARRPGR